MNKENPLITRKETITVEASQKHSIYKRNDEYETILTNGITINNGDVIQIGGVYCDTTSIDPTKIRIEEDIDVKYQNGMYITNQAITTLIPSKIPLDRGFVTDNQPYAFCEFHEDGVSNMTHYESCTMKAGLARPLDGNWGGFTFNMQYKDAGGEEKFKQIIVPPFHNEYDPVDHATALYNVDIIGLSSFEPIAINPDTGLPSNNWGTGLNSPGHVFEPIIAGSFNEAPVTNGHFTPVINSGGFKILAGDYSPEYLAKLLTDDFSKINADNLRNRIVQPTGPRFVTPVAGSQINPIGTTYGEIEVGSIANQEPWNYLPFTNEEKNAGAYIGWTMKCEFQTVIGPPAVYSSSTLTIIDSPDDYKFRGQTSGAGWSVLELIGAVYPANGGMRLVLTPPVGYEDDGSNFLQTTTNYNQFTVAGQRRFGFVDCSKTIPTNILTYVPPLVGAGMPFGTTEMEVLWDEDLDRFKFNYIHFPFTHTADSGPALVKQINLVFETGVGYVSNYDKGSVNQVSGSYSGIYWTHLEPRNLFEKIMGFNYTDKSIIVSPKLDTTVTNSFENGLTIPAGIPEEYISVHTPLFKLNVGQNITRNSITISDMIGLPLNYTTYTPIAATTPTVPNGRVLITENQVDAIIAENKGSQIGVQDSGYYVVEIEIGMSYNSTVGSASQQKSFTRNIRAIVDRYYSVKSYTSMTGSNTEYIHYGNSIQIKSLKIKLRNSDGTLIEHIGNDNTVFLKILKNNTVDISEDLKGDK